MDRVSTVTECPGCGTGCDIVGWRKNGEPCFLVCPICEAMWTRRGDGSPWRLPDITTLAYCLSKLPVDVLGEEDMREILKSAARMANFALDTRRRCE